MPTTISEEDRAVLKSVRQRIFFSFFGLGGAAVLGTIVVLYFITDSLWLTLSNDMFLSIFSMGLIIFSIFWFAECQKLYQNEYKLRVVKPHVEKHFTKCKYIPRLRPSKDTMRLSGVLPAIPGRAVIQGEDYIRFAYGCGKVQAYELDLSEVIRTKDGTRHVPLFDGIFAAIPLHRTMESPLIIRPKTFLSAIFKGNTPELYPRLSRVKLLSPDYERTFSTWCDDQITSRKILKPVQMEKLTRLAEKYTFGLSLVGDHAYLALSNEHFMFHPRLFCFPPRSDEKRLERIDKSLAVLKTFLEELEFLQAKPVDLNEANKRVKMPRMGYNNKAFNGFLTTLLGTKN